ncbi:MAG: PaaI family thioesterase [Actinomycetota bacterium]
MLSGDVALPVNEHMGFAVEPTGDAAEAVAFRWTVPPEYCNSAGNLQGGVLAAFADALLGGATAARLPADTYPALAEMKLSIFRPAPAGTTLTGRGYVIKAGRRVLFAEAEVYDDHDRLIAKASGTEIPAEG